MELAVAFCPQGLLVDGQCARPGAAVLLAVLSDLGRWGLCDDAGGRARAALGALGAPAPAFELTSAEDAPLGVLVFAGRPAPGVVVPPETIDDDACCAWLLAAARTHLEDKLHVVLDMDQTLLDDGVPRPGLLEFLSALAPRAASIGIWTAADRAWLDAMMVEVLLPTFAAAGAELTYALHRDRCRREVGYDEDGRPDSSVNIKHLHDLIHGAHGRALGMVLGRTVIIDDRPEYVRPPPRVLRIEPWSSSAPNAADDRALLDVLDQLDAYTARPRTGAAPSAFTA